jgi:hypothetical protein
MIDGAEELERVLPGFEPFRLGRVEVLHIDFDNSGSINARIRIVYWMPGPPEILIELTFYSVRQMRIPELGSSAFELSELEIRDVSDRGLEGVQREVLDHGPGRFALLCHRVMVTAVLAREGEKLISLWTHTRSDDL